MATNIVVQGSASLTYGGSLLGYTDEGVTIEFQYGLRDVFTDLRGPFMPTDVLLTGKRATISGTLLYFDDTVLSSAMNLGGGSEGGIAAQGEFILGGSNDATLVVGGTTAGAITYTFAHAYLASLSRTVSSVETRVPFVFNAIWNGSGSLYTTS